MKKIMLLSKVIELFEVDSILLQLRKQQRERICEKSISIHRTELGVRERKEQLTRK